MGDIAMYSVEVASGPGSTLIAKSKDAQITIGLDGKSFTPMDVLLASLGSCKAVYIRKYAQGAKIDLKDFSLKLEAEFSKEPLVCFKKIKVTIDLKGLDLDERRKQAMLDFIKNCPVYNTLQVKPQVDTQIL